jgi:hypothetical protein
MNDCTSSPRLLTVLLVLLFTVVMADCPASAKPKALAIDELEEIRQEISLLNLLRGLYLSKEQVQKLVGLSSKAGALRQSARDQFLPRQTEIIAAFSHLRDTLYLEPGREKEAQTKAQDFSNQIKDATGNLSDKVSAIEEEALAVLSSSQQQIVADFKPCLVPPKDLRNPVRVGQAGAESGPLLKLTAMIHAVPADLWAKRGAGLLDKMAAKQEAEAGAMSADMKSDIRRRLAAIAEKIRALSDVDYALKSEQLAAELLLIDPQKALKHGHKKTGDIARWFLSDCAATVLPKWLTALDSTPTSAGAEFADEDDPNAAVSLKEAGAKALMTLSKLHRQRSREKSVPAYESLAQPIQRAIAANDPSALIKAAFAAFSQLAEIRADKPVIRALAQTARHAAKSTGLPLLHPQHDPFGLAADLKQALDHDPDPQGVKQVRAIFETLVQCKTFRR